MKFTYTKIPATQTILPKQTITINNFQLTIKIPYFCINFTSKYNCMNCFLRIDCIVFVKIQLIKNQINENRNLLLSRFRC